MTLELAWSTSSLPMAFIPNSSCGTAITESGLNEDYNENEKFRQYQYGHGILNYKWLCLCV